MTKQILVRKSTFLKKEDCTMILFVLTPFLKRHDLSLSRHLRYYRDLYKNHLQVKKIKQEKQEGSVLLKAQQPPPPSRLEQNLHGIQGGPTLLKNVQNIMKNKQEGIGRRKKKPIESVIMIIIGGGGEGGSKGGDHAPLVFFFNPPNLVVWLY